MTDTPKPSDFGMNNDSDIAWTIVELLKKGLIKDSGRRRDGQILWVMADVETQH